MTERTTLSIDRGVLTTGNLIACRGQQLANPPTPLGGTWAVDVYAIDGVILYNMA